MKNDGHIFRKEYSHANAYSECMLNDISIFKIVKLKTGYSDECFVHLLDPLLAL